MVSKQKTYTYSEKIWYSPIYMLRDYGFYVHDTNDKYFLAYKHPNKKKTIEVEISKRIYDVIKKEWK